MLGSLPDQLVIKLSFLPFACCEHSPLRLSHLSSPLVPIFETGSCYVIQAGFDWQATISGLHFLSTKATGDDTSMVEEV